MLPLEKQGIIIQDKAYYCTYCHVSIAGDAWNVDRHITRGRHLRQQEVVVERRESKIRAKVNDALTQRNNYILETAAEKHKLDLRQLLIDKPENVDAQ